MRNLNLPIERFDVDLSNRKKEAINAPAKFLEKRFPTPYDDFSGRYKAGEIDYSFYKIFTEFPICERAIFLYRDLIGNFTIESENSIVERSINEIRERIIVNEIHKGLTSVLSVNLWNYLVLGHSFMELIQNPISEGIIGVTIPESDRIDFKKIDNKMRMVVKNNLGQEKPIDDSTTIFHRGFKISGVSNKGLSLFFSIPYMMQIEFRKYASYEGRYIRISEPIFAFLVKALGENVQGATISKLLGEIEDGWIDANKSRRAGHSMDMYIPLSHGVDFETKNLVGDGTNGFDDKTIGYEIDQMVCIGLAIPGFLIGIQPVYGGTYNLTTRQADNLIQNALKARGDMEYFIRELIDFHLLMAGIVPEYKINWDAINLQDEVENARAELLASQAAKNKFEIISKFQEAGGPLSLEMLIDFMIENKIIPADLAQSISKKKAFEALYQSGIVGNAEKVFRNLEL